MEQSTAGILGPERRPEEAGAARQQPASADASATVEVLTSGWNIKSPRSGKKERKEGRNLEALATELGAMGFISRCRVESLFFFFTFSPSLPDLCSPSQQMSHRQSFNVFRACSAFYKMYTFVLSIYELLVLINMV